MPLSQAEDVYITIGPGSGSPGSQNTITVSLENPMDKVKGVGLTICDEGNHLSCKGCDPMGRASEFFCVSNEQKDGCAKIILYSVGDLVEEGDGPILTISYKVSEGASSGQCIDLNPKDVSVSDENKKPLKVVVEQGEFCITGGGEDETTTTSPATTTTEGSTLTTTARIISDIPTTTIPKITKSATLDITTTIAYEDTTPETAYTTTTKEPTSKTPESAESKKEITPATTILPSSPYRVVITPSSVTLDSGGAVKFSAKTISDGDELEGSFLWEIVPASTIGSTIDENGLLTAGNNMRDTVITETIQSTDTRNGNSLGLASVTIEAYKKPPVGCTSSISPSSATVLPGDSLTFSVRNLGESCEKGSFIWRVNSRIGSWISANGVYTAGNNQSRNSVYDIIIVKDTVNNLTSDAMVTVSSGENGFQSTPKAKQNVFGGGIYLKILILFVFIAFTIGIILFKTIKR